MPWAKPIFNDIELVYAMKCCVCTKIKRKGKILVFRWDSVDKHVGKKKVTNGKWIMDLICTLKMKSLMLNFLQ